MNKKDILKKLNKVSIPIDLDNWKKSINKWDKIIKDYEDKKRLR